MWTSKPLFSNLDYLVHELLLYKHINTFFFSFIFCHFTLISELLHVCMNKHAVPVGK